MSDGAIHGFTLEMLLDALADRLFERIEKRDSGLISHLDRRRGLGPRRQREAVKRRIKERAGGAYIVGREYKLTPDALREELERFGPRGLEHDGAGNPVEPKDPPSRRARAHKAGADSAEVAALRLKLDAELGALGHGARKPRRGH